MTDFRKQFIHNIVETFDKVKQRKITRDSYTKYFDSIFDVMEWDKTVDTSVNYAIKHPSKKNKDIIERSLAKIESLNEESLWKRDVAGEIPIVPSFISGDPACMRYRTRSSSVTAPVRVFAPASTQAGVTSDQFAFYTGATLGAVLAIARTRPVELHMFSAVEATAKDPGRSAGSFIVWKIPTDYFSVDFAASMSDMSVGTAIGCHSLASKALGFFGNFHFSMKPQCQVSMDLTRQALQLDEQDVLLPEVNRAVNWDEQLKNILDCAKESGITMNLDELKNHTA